jgi:hypothetical protein
MMTNSDKIRAMSDKELAYFLSDHMSECERSTECNQHCYGCDLELCEYENCLNWLKVEYDENKEDGG